MHSFCFAPLIEGFATGAGLIIASFTWFFSMGFGARYLGPLFQKPMA